MADVFVSYKREDEVAVGRLVKALRGADLSVWWDRDIPTGAPWEDTIEKEHAAARALVVCWSKAGVGSENVKAEARRARSRGQLVQTYMEPCEPPMFFGEHQGVDLSAWAGKSDDPRFQAVLAAVKAILAGEAISTGVGAASPQRRNGMLVLAAGAGVAALVIAGTAFALWPRSSPAPAPTPQELTLEKIKGSWGVGNACDVRYAYLVTKDASSGETRIVAQGSDTRYEGRMVSITEGVVLSEALTPVEDRGNLVEIRPEPNQLVLQNRSTDVRQVLTRCG